MAPPRPKPTVIVSPPVREVGHALDAFKASAAENFKHKKELAQLNHWFNIALNNMARGLSMFDAEQRLIVCNNTYKEIYNIPKRLTKPGTPLADLVRHHVKKETGRDGPKEIAKQRQWIASHVAALAQGKTFTHTQHLKNGRVVLVTNQPLADGGWVTTLEDVTERRRSDAWIAHLALYDALTGLPNRVLFQQQLEGALSQIEPGEQLAVLYLDIDEFKSINDSLGHRIGDELLKSVAVSLRNCIGTTDFVARLGGDEFAIVQTAIKDPEDAIELVTRIYRAIREPYECLGHLVTTDASIGIALAPRHGSNLGQLLQNADLAMYNAKTGGRRNYRLFEPGMETRVKARRVLERDLRKAVMDGGFEVHYQPIVDLRSNRISGCEALLRWRHSERGMISPAEFISVAEDTGLIGPLGEWVLNTACAEAATWPSDVRLAVNVSPVQFRSNTLALKVVEALAASGLSASRLELEITEAVPIRDDDTALAVLHQLRMLGVRIALDDFGTGYSSLSYLQRFPFDKIKIDRCFVADIAAVGGSSIIQAIVTIAAARHITTTAEGVETEQQRSLLRALGCTEMQGYLFSPAKPAAEIRRLFFSNRDKVVA